jgi:hypothetical protein
MRKGPSAGLRQRSGRWVLLAAVALLAATSIFPQFGGRRRGPVYERGNIPEWDLPSHKHDCFTFVRIKYRSTRESSSYSWWTDYPDADLNLSWRLQQLTALRVEPTPKVIDILDSELLNYPFAFMSGVPAIQMNDEEIAALRRYLLRGGFVMVDDFWGEANWAHFEEEVLRRVFPDRRAEELLIDHPIFNCVFPVKEKPQIPNVSFAVANRETGRTWEVEDGRTPHYRGISDDKGRLMMLICHNTDFGDGWEEEGTDPWYFQEFSEKKAYPLGINIIFYALTH